MIPGTRLTVTLRAGAAAILMALLAGCTGLHLPDAFPWGGGEEEKDPDVRVPARMTDVWEYTVFHERGLPGVRGFGGRVMFYTNDGGEPVKVDGTLTVYAFDDSQQDPTDGRPIRRYVFPPEHLKTFYKKSKLGHSYNLWLPWDEVGGPEKKIGLLCRFEASEGGVVTSQPSHQVLPGPEGEGPPRTTRRHPASGPSAVRQASHEVPVEGNAGLGAGASSEKDNGQKARTMLTLDVTPSMTQQMAPSPGGKSKAGTPGTGSQAEEPPVAPQPPASTTATGAEQHEGAAGAPRDSAATAPPPERTGIPFQVATSPSGRFVPWKSQARRASSSRPARVDVPTRPSPAERLSRLRQSPQSDSSAESPESAATGRQGPG